MAKVELNSALRRIRGTMDNWVYRRNGDGVAIAKRPTLTGEHTASQVATREKFRAAAGYAKSALLDAALRARYEAAAKAARMQVRVFAMTDYLTPPVVITIDTSSYHGRVGDIIKVNAFDDFEVAGVTVAVKDGEGAVLMQGATVLTDGRWNYTSTAGIAAGEAVTIEAVATDRPGNTGSRVIPLVIA